MTLQRKYTSALALTGLLGAIAVGLGALGAHALRAQVDAGVMSERNFAGFETAVKYHMYHVIAMLVVTCWRVVDENKYLKAAFYFFLTGIVLFSGSLYLLCTREITGAESLRMLGPVTPVGGLFFIAGWLSMCLPLFRKR